MNLNIFSKIKENIITKKNIFLDKINNLFKSNLNETDFESLEKTLIQFDISFETTEKILKKLKEKKYKDINEMKENLAIIMFDLLKNSEKQIDLNKKNPLLILIIGINGVGKTTTVTKLANLYKNLNKKVLIAAGDTFRVAGISQLSTICEKYNLQIIKQHYGADSASVIFDAYNFAKNKNFDILIADTSGRLHTNTNLMLELKKIKTALNKIDNNLPHETIMIIDSNLGQNSIKQVKSFNDFIKITGLIISKLDGTSKAGIILDIVSYLKIPILYVTNGEKINKIEPFDSKKYIYNILKIKI